MVIWSPSNMQGLLSRLLVLRFYLFFCLVLLNYTAFFAEGKDIYPLPGGDGPIQAKHYVQEIVTEILPCLFNYTIDVVNYDAPGYYLRSAPKPSTVLFPPERRVYQMFVNPQLFNESFGPSQNAMHSIITHELNHILDYTHMSLTELADFGIHYALNYTFLVWYEHETDHRVLELGFGDGLKEYREWIYSVLNSTELHTKRTEYYTPLQIIGWIDENPGVYVNPCYNYSWNYTCNVCDPYGNSEKTYNYNLFSL